MPSPTYTTVLSIVSQYVDPDKARDVIGRQLANGGANPDSLDKAGLAKVLLGVTTATGLYVSDVTQRQDMVNRIKAAAA